jgi:hypothetical protein
MNGADYFTFDGLRIHGTHNLYAYVVRLSSQADYNVFKNCEISAPNYNYKGSDNNRDYAIDGAFTVTMRAETSAGCFCESTQQVVVDRLNNELIGNQDQFVVYPSPNNGNFTISLAEQSEGTIEISDAVGNILYTTTAKAVKISNGQVNLKGLSSGIYFVRYNSPNQTTVRKMQVIE